MRARARLPIALPVPLGIGGNYRLLFQDDFNGPVNSAPDLTKWSYLKQNQVVKSATNRAQNTFLDGAGSLVVRVTSADIGFGAELSAGGVISNLTLGAERIVEFRAQLTSGWIAGWTLPNDGNSMQQGGAFDPTFSTEVDIFECFDGGAASTNEHWGDYGSFAHEIGLVGTGVADKTAFNVYSCWNSPLNGWLKFYLNGALIRTESTIVSSCGGNPILIDQETLGDITSATASIDYVRAWGPA